MNFNNWVGAALFACATIGAGVAVAAPPVTITMDDLPTQPLDGLVHPDGVTFGFTVGGVASSDANYNSGGPGSLTFIQDPSIEGTTSGVLSVDFATPVNHLEFGIAVASDRNHPDGVVVELFSPTDISLGTGDVDLFLFSFDAFPNGQFQYMGSPVSRAEVNFEDLSLLAPRFAFDNLTFTVVPEPATWALACVGALLAVKFAKRRS